MHGVPIFESTSLSDDADNDETSEVLPPLTDEELSRGCYAALLNLDKNEAWTESTIPQLQSVVAALTKPAKVMTGIDFVQDALNTFNRHEHPSVESWVNLARKVEPALRTMIKAEDMRTQEALAAAPRASSYSMEERNQCRQAYIRGEAPLTAYMAFFEKGDVPPSGLNRWDERTEQLRLLRREYKESSAKVNMPTERELARHPPTFSFATDQDSSSPDDGATDCAHHTTLVCLARKEGDDAVAVRLDRNQGVAAFRQRNAEYAQAAQDGFQGMVGVPAVITDGGGGLDMEQRSSDIGREAQKIRQQAFEFAAF
eukprot:GEMP01045650.1.p1 GENE.GEMP01045650.1~~GEMP01045650.1.p1  ORF type:complete len:314 (+),score=87.26 GEMP01045650.1:121-1062(+)